MLRLIIPAGGMGLILSTTYNGVSVIGVDQKSILRHAIPSYLLGRASIVSLQLEVWEINNSVLLLRIV